MGGGARDSFAVTREMAKICLGVATAFFAIQLGGDPILVGATDAQKQKWLGTRRRQFAGRLCRNRTGAQAAISAALKTKADPIVDAAGVVTGYKITGTKQFISTGGYADIVTVLASTPQGPSFFCG